jgi:hypothetical protein
MTELAFVGDICLTPDLQEKLNAGLNLQGEYITENRQSVANLECPFTNIEKGITAKFASLKSVPKHLSKLKWITNFGLANNHISDFGHQGAIDTKESLQKEGLNYGGYGDSLKEALEPVTVQCGDVKINIYFMACISTNGQNFALVDGEGVAPLAVENIDYVLKKYKSEADHHVLYAHWGVEDMHKIVNDQIKLAHYAIDIGFESVIGCHGHVIQPYETYKSKSIFYGVGNFIFGDIPNKVSDKEGNLIHHIKKLKRASKQSLVPVFDVSKSKLSIKHIEYYELSDNQGLKSIKKGDLTFNLDHQNEILKKHVHFFKKELLTNINTEYLTTYENSYFGHYYHSEYVEKIGFFKRSKYRLRQVWRLIYNAYIVILKR